MQLSDWSMRHWKVARAPNKPNEWRIATVHTVWRRISFLGLGRQGNLPVALGFFQHREKIKQHLTLQELFDCHTVTPPSRWASPHCEDTSFFTTGTMGLHHALCDSSVVLIPSTASELFVSYGQCGATRQGKEQICKMLLQQHPLLVITMETQSQYRTTCRHCWAQRRRCTFLMVVSTTLHKAPLTNWTLL